MKIRKTCMLLLFVVSVATNAQSNFNKFLKLSGPTKKWVLLHPFKAKKALIISSEAQRVSDSIAKTNGLDKDAAGGQVDAFRHAYWMARLRQEIGKCAARSLGKAHEKENYGTFKKNKLEDGVVPDKISSTMDLHNNEEGLKLTIKGSKTPKKGLIYKIINAIAQGKMKIIKKDQEGNFLTCDEKIIRLESLKGKWENNKCLVSSNKTYLKLF
ncbi:DUF6973 domain-containing protein [Polaribacter litorisediminis]|uniref:DUF6973 domain-containing protein n=1 Tax=Polaribacter litorisediminis TaxID=1908341 RepID=UPI001CC0AEDA|nr:hypothetical protein [Polaribacter litorisediminis]